MRSFLLVALLLPSAFAGGGNSKDVIAALNDLSEKSIITNYFLSNPDSKLCGKGKSYSSLGQKLAMATEEFKAVWLDFKPNAEQKKYLKEWSKNCSAKDDCFSLKTLFDLNPEFYKEISVDKTGDSTVDYSTQIKGIKKVCQKLDF